MIRVGVFTYDSQFLIVFIGGSSVEECETTRVGLLGTLDAFYISVLSSS